jgi:general secretion pathway protein M
MSTRTSAISEGLDRLRTAFGQLSPRERIMVGAGAAAVLLTLIYVAAWQPLVKAHAQRALALERARSIAIRIEQAGAQQRAQGGTRAIDRSTSLLAAVDQTSRSPTLGKPPSRVQPEGDREVKVWIDNVAFANLLRWLQELETRYGIRADSAEIERGNAPGVVNARISLVRD